jgi:type II secretory ATPase GspE/PulE/Tfp pilus assembly ATPase PilB-like protein
MTGHQVYSTLHTNSAIGSIPRLLDIGVLPDIMADNIIGVIGQRLVRKLCTHCRETYEPSDMEKHLLGKQESNDITLYHAKGCDECDGRGYSGRVALMEILRMNNELEKLIAHRANIHEVKQQAGAMGFRFLAEDGIKKVLAGITSLDELSRVIDLTSRV